MMDQIQHLAREYAGRFYEMKRSDRFRSKGSLTRVKYFERDAMGNLVEKSKVMRFFDAYPTSKQFADGHWPLWVEAARKSLVTMLALPESRVSQHMKESIHAALILDRTKEYAGLGRRLLQQAANV